MIPSPWVAVVLTLGTMRLCREISYSDFPPTVKIRAWLTGATVTRNGSSNSLSGLTSEEPTLAWVYKRPTLEKFISCVWCSGFWLSIGVFVAWRLEPRWTLYVLAPFALSTAAALCVKWLDP